MEKMDYTDPQCPFCVEGYRDKPTVHPIDVAAAVAKIDEHLNRDDYEGAQKVLNYWIGEAEIGRDMRGLLSLKNEQMGLMRKLGRGDEAIAASEEALALVEKIGFEGTVTAATTYVNCGTVQKMFGDSALAIKYDEMALDILKSEFEKAVAQAGDMQVSGAQADGAQAGDAQADGAQAEVDNYAMRLGSLYNNMALALADVGRYDDARLAYVDALKVMTHMTYGEREQAITYLNLADLVVAESLYGSADADADQGNSAESAEAAAGAGGAGGGTDQGNNAGGAGARRLIIADDGSRVISYPNTDMELTILDYVGKAKDLLNTEGLPHDGYHAFVLEKCADSFAFYGFNSVAEKYKELSKEIYEKN